MSAIDADTPSWYTRAQLPRGYTVVENGAIEIGPYGRAGASAIRFSGDPDDYIERVCDGHRTEVPSGATAIGERDLRVTSYPSAGQRKMILAVLEGGDVQDGLYLEDDGTLSACRGEGGALTVLGTSTFVLPLATDYRLGFKVLIHASAGTVDVQAQGPGDNTPQNVLALTGKDTLETASATWDGYRLGSASPAVSTCENWVWKDGSGGVHDDLSSSPQNVVGVVRPIADGAHSDWIRSTGLQQFAGIDDIAADDDISYNQGDVDGDIDVVQMAQAPDPNQPIAFVVMNFVARNGGGSEEVSHVMRQGGLDTVGASHGLAANYLPYVEVHQVSPDATPWSTAVWAALDGAGYQRTDPT